MSNDESEQYQRTIAALRAENQRLRRLSEDLMLQLKEVREACRQESAMNNMKYDSLGHRTNALISKAAAAISDSAGEGKI